jgi:hypothetical protein
MSPNSREYWVAVAKLKRAEEMHKATLTMPGGLSPPLLNWCDPSVMVGISYNSDKDYEH